MSTITSTDVAHVAAVARNTRMSRGQAMAARGIAVSGVVRIDDGTFAAWHVRHGIYREVIRPVPAAN